jgi:hypothetical protein
MDLTNEAAVGGREATSIAVASAPAGETPLGVREAARNLVNWRQSREKLLWRLSASGEGGDRGDRSPAPEQEATDATAKGEREAPVAEPASAERPPWWSRRKPGATHFCISHWCCGRK